VVKFCHYGKVCPRILYWIPTFVGMTNKVFFPQLKLYTLLGISFSLDYSKTQIKLIKFFSGVDLIAKKRGKL
jgi:hypothetical protein